MAAATAAAIFLCLVLSSSTLFLPSSAQTCSDNSFSPTKAFSSCNTLGRLNSILHWTYNPSAGTADIAYRAPMSSDGWVAWALNPTGSGMIGAQALVAVLNNGAATALTTSVTDRTPTMQQADLSFTVTNLNAAVSNSIVTITATISLPGNGTTFNHVWQASNVLNNGVPGAHLTNGDNVQSVGSINFQSGAASSGGNSKLRRTNTHGVLNAVSWGILMPIGAIIARYLRVFESADPAWFYLHITCQSTAYVLGVAGWGLGLKLGSESKGITYHRHRYIGIVLFCLATLQVFAIFMRPRKDHKYRYVWNIYHHSVGYTVIILSVVNIFKGFDILLPAKKWKNAYIGVIVTLAVIAAVLEIFTWIVVIRRKSRNSNKTQQGAYAENNIGYGARV